MVSTILASSPTPVDSRRRERVRLMFNVVWMGNEMQTSSGWQSTHLASPVNVGLAAPEAECLDECGPSIPEPARRVNSATEIPPVNGTESAAERTKVEEYKHSPVAETVGMSYKLPDSLAPNKIVHRESGHGTRCRDVADDFGAHIVAGKLCAEGDSDVVEVAVKKKANSPHKVRYDRDCSDNKLASLIVNSRARSIVKGMNTGPRNAEGAEEPGIHRKTHLGRCQCLKDDEKSGFHRFLKVQREVIACTLEIKMGGNQGILRSTLA
ncbi:hypothetical protein C8R45DRAFT_1045139 [Mycena sanguinolenta]|nr:hypothetical protein C8R45DRAFT_1045139 [Mycena sanguinolenta]